MMLSKRLFVVRCSHRRSTVTHSSPSPFFILLNKEDTHEKKKKGEWVNQDVTIMKLQEIEVTIMKLQEIEVNVSSLSLSLSLICFYYQSKRLVNNPVLVGFFQDFFLDFEIQKEIRTTLKGIRKTTCFPQSVPMKGQFAFPSHSTHT